MKNKKLDRIVDKYKDQITTTDVLVIEADDTGDIGFLFKVKNTNSIAYQLHDQLCQVVYPEPTYSIIGLRDIKDAFRMVNSLANEAIVIDLARKQRK